MADTELTSFHDLIALEPSGDTFSTFISDDWAQGRSTFGGLTAALCLRAALDTYPDLPPLRTAQITFVGPALGDVTLTTEVLRQGRNVTFLQADLSGEKGLATRCVFGFGVSRESAQQREDLDLQDVPAPEDVSSLFPEAFGPNFARHHLDQHLAKGHPPVSGATEADNWIWARLKAWRETDDVVTMLAMADALPPVEMSCFKAPANISTMTWLINFLSDAPTTRDGWWLIHARAEHTQDGYSSQDMIGWNRDGEPMFTARQSIAIFA